MLCHMLQQECTRMVDFKDEDMFIVTEYDKFFTKVSPKSTTDLEKAALDFGELADAIRN